jgi:hypothetical protein
LAVKQMGAWRQIGLLLGCGGCLAVLGTVAFSFHQFAQSLPNWDYSRLPPERAFKVSFGQPPPPGVGDLKATGAVGLGGGQFWLRFRCSLPRLKALVTGYSASRAIVTRPEDSAWDTMWDSPQAGLDPRTVGWDAVKRLKDQTVFQKSSEGGSRLIVYDRDQRIAYAHYWSN